MVKGNDVNKQIEKIKTHVKNQGYTVLDHEPSDDERKQYPLIAKITARAGDIMHNEPYGSTHCPARCTSHKTTVDYDIIRIPSAGWITSFIFIRKILGAQPISVPIVNYDNNQHAENENLQLQYLWEGIETMAAIMMMK